MSSREICMDFAICDKSPEATCHLLPCRIEHKDLRVKSREYFWPTVKELKLGGDDDEGRKLKHDQLINSTNNSQEQPILTASFRGKPFQGKCVKLPEGYSGHVVSKHSDVPKNLSSTKSTQIKKHFNEFTYWNWDELPSKEDTVVKGIGWIKIAQTLHDPIE